MKKNACVARGAIDNFEPESARIAIRVGEASWLVDLKSDCFLANPVLEEAMVTFVLAPGEDYPSAVFQIVQGGELVYLDESLAGGE